MTCEECRCEADGRAQGWEAYLVDLDDDGQNDVIFFCRICAANEFHRLDAGSDPEERTVNRR